jgi:hypothetical protein
VECGLVFIFFWVECGLVFIFGQETRLQLNPRQPSVSFSNEIAQANKQNNGNNYWQRPASTGCIHLSPPPQKRKKKKEKRGCIHRLRTNPCYTPSDQILVRALYPIFLQNADTHVHTCMHIYRYVYTRAYTFYTYESS